MSTNTRKTGEQTEKGTKQKTTKIMPAVKK